VGRPYFSLNSGETNTSPLATHMEDYTLLQEYLTAGSKYKEYLKEYKAYDEDHTNLLTLEESEFASIRFKVEELRRNSHHVHSWHYNS
jgi:hypothetical protein